MKMRFLTEIEHSKTATLQRKSYAMERSRLL